MKGGGGAGLSLYSIQEGRRGHESARATWAPSSARLPPSSARSQSPPGSARSPPASARSWVPGSARSSRAPAADAGGGPHERVPSPTLRVVGLGPPPLIRLLRQRHGTLLKAWRLDFDLRKAGWVSHAEFARSCRQRLGVQGRESAAYWQLYRPTGSEEPLRFHEFSQEEAQNFEGFEQCLWNSFGLDLGKTWDHFDKRRRSKVMLGEFVSQARSLGFCGNAQMLFRGLVNNSGPGQDGCLRREDLDYIKVLSGRVSSLQHSDPVVVMLCGWAQEEMGGVGALADHLGLRDDEHGVEHSLPINALAASLTTSGFRGEAHKVASLAARHGDGTQVTRSSLLALLGGRRGKSAPSGSQRRSPAISPASPRGQPAWPLGGGPPGGVDKPAWVDKVDTTSQSNGRRMPSQRVYFDNPPRLFEPPQRAGARDVPPAGAGGHARRSPAASPTQPASPRGAAPRGPATQASPRGPSPPAAHASASPGRARPSVPPLVVCSAAPASPRRAASRRVVPGQV